MNDILEPEPKRQRRSSKSNPNMSLDSGDRRANQGEIPILNDKNSLATEEPIIPQKKDRRDSKRASNIMNNTDYATNKGLVSPSRNDEAAVDGPYTKADTSDVATKNQEDCFGVT